MGVILDTRHLDQSNDFGERGDDQTFARQDAQLHRFSVSNPHPGFGKDPNILNEYGHTKFPMWIDSKRTGERIIVENEKEKQYHEMSDEELKQSETKSNTDQEIKKQDDGSNPWA